MSSISRLGAVLLGASLVGPLAAAQSPEDCHTDSIAVAPTNWSSSLDLPRFDPALGILTGIRFQLGGEAQGQAAIESLDATPTTVNTSFEATLTLTRPDNSVIVVSTPDVAFSDPLTAFDGLVDFAGTSGITHGGIVATETETVTSSDPADLALFTGPSGNPGTISLPVGATATSTASGSGNLITQFQTSAGAEVTVCYLYELDCNANGVPDDEDIANGMNDLDGDGIPDECQPGVKSYCEGSGSINGGVDCPCGNNGQQGEGCANGNGTGGLLSATGTPSVSNDTLQVTASQIYPVGSPGMFFTGTNPTNGGAGVAFGSGLRCVDNAVRLVKIDGGGTLPLPNSPPLHMWLGAGAGDHSFIQYWYRNPTGPCPGIAANTTNGLEITWGL